MPNSQTANSQSNELARNSWELEVGIWELYQLKVTVWL
jgi:hypothetical protein